MMKFLTSEPHVPLSPSTATTVCFVFCSGSSSSNIKLCPVAVSWGRLVDDKGLSGDAQQVAVSHGRTQNTQNKGNCSCNKQHI